MKSDEENLIELREALRISKEIRALAKQLEAVQEDAYEFNLVSDADEAIANYSGTIKIEEEALRKKQRTAS